MYLLLILFGLFLIALGFVLYNSDKSDRGENIFVICFVSIMLGTMSYFLGSLAIVSITGTYQLTNNQNIISMSASSGISGDFVLGSGSIRSERMYIYRIQQADGGITERRCSVDRATVYEISEGNPHIEVYFKLAPAKWTYINDGTGQDWFVKLYVPKGTVIRDFNIQ